MLFVLLVAVVSATDDAPLVIGQHPTAPNRPPLHVNAHRNRSKAVDGGLNSRGCIDIKTWDGRRIIPSAIERSPRARRAAALVADDRAAIEISIFTATRMRVYIRPPRMG